MIYGYYYDNIDDDWEFTPFDCYDWVDPTKYRLNFHGVLVHTQGDERGDSLEIFPHPNDKNPYFVLMKNGRKKRCYVEDILRDQAEYNKKIGRKWAYYVV